MHLIKENAHDGDIKLIMKIYRIFKLRTFPLVYFYWKLPILNNAPVTNLLTFTVISNFNFLKYAEL